MWDLQLCFKKHCQNLYGCQTTKLQGGALETEIYILTLQNFEVWKQNFIATLELFLTMLGTELAHGLKTKFVTHIKNYNFY